MAFDIKDEARPAVGFGAGFSPFAYASFLAGATYSTFGVDAGMTGEVVDEAFWTVTLALGVNADILTLLKIK